MEKKDVKSFFGRQQPRIFAPVGAADGSRGRAKRCPRIAAPMNVCALEGRWNPSYPRSSAPAGALTQSRHATGGCARFAGLPPATIPGPSGANKLRAKIWVKTRAYALGYNLSPLT